MENGFPIIIPSDKIFPRYHWKLKYFINFQQPVSFLLFRIFKNGKNWLFWPQKFTVGTYVQVKHSACRFLAVSNNSTTVLWFILTTKPDSRLLLYLHFEPSQDIIVNVPVFTLTLNQCGNRLFLTKNPPKRNETGLSNN